jgi:hypothetical protein
MCGPRRALRESVAARAWPVPLVVVPYRLMQPSGSPTAGGYVPKADGRDRRRRAVRQLPFASHAPGTGQACQADIRWVDDVDKLRRVRPGARPPRVATKSPLSTRRRPARQKARLQCRAGRKFPSRWQGRGRCPARWIQQRGKTFRAPGLARQLECPGRCRSPATSHATCAWRR